MHSLEDLLLEFRNGPGWVAVEYFIAITALVTIALGVYAQRDARRQTDELKRLGDDAKKQTDELTRLADESKEQAKESRKQAEELKDLYEHIRTSLSTRSVGPFPGSLEALNEMLIKAKASIEIWVDVIGYGRFSAPSLFRDYMAVLRRQGGRPDFKVTIHYYDQPTGLAARLRQFKADDEVLYQNLPLFAGKKPAEYKTKFDEFSASADFTRYRTTLNPTAAQKLVDWKGFFDLMEERDDITHRDLGENQVNLHRFEGVLPIFLWMVDREEYGKAEAMFSVITRGGGETAFFTRDPNLLSALYSIVRSFEKDESLKATV